MMTRVKHVLSKAEACKDAKNKSSNHEIRNSTQWQITKVCKILNRLHWDSVFSTFSDGVCCGFLFSHLGFALRLERFERLKQLERS